MTSPVRSREIYFFKRSIDNSKVPNKVRSHPRICLIESSAIAAFAHIKEMIDAKERALVIEDSCHTYENTLAVLRLYSQFIQGGDYFIVEDSICHHGLEVGPSPGPYEAIETFLGERDDFVVDRSRESFFITWNPKGFLKKRR